MHSIEHVIHAWSYMSDAWQFVFLCVLFFVLAGCATFVCVVYYAIKQSLRERALRRRIYSWRY